MTAEARTNPGVSLWRYCNSRILRLKQSYDKNFLQCLYKKYGSSNAFIGRFYLYRLGSVPSCYNVCVRMACPVFHSTSRWHSSWFFLLSRHSSDWSMYWKPKQWSLHSSRAAEGQWPCPSVRGSAPLCFQPFWLHKVLAPLVLEGENGKMVLSILLGGGVNAEFHTQKYKLLVSILPFNQLCNHRETNWGSPLNLPVLIQVWGERPSILVLDFWSYSVSCI